jgi:tetratricopeptide (TPR) repeat protein
VREHAAQKLGEWSHARYLAESAAVDRLLDAGRHADAVPAARSLLTRAQAAGESGYEGAAYDLAICHAHLGRALAMGGDPRSALTPLGEAQSRFRRLADAGDEDAARMVSVSLTERADCLSDLGQLDQAAAAYEEAMKLDEKRGDLRDVAVGKGQLGTVRMLQHRYADALAAYTEARETFERLGESGTIAGVWHQIGMVCQETGQYEAAERAYQESLRIWVEKRDRSHEAMTLNQLGRIYGLMDRTEDAVRFFRQAADIYAAPDIADVAKEGATRSNIASQLVKLGRHDEARREIQRAIECDEPFGHAAEPWKSFAILSDLEHTVGNASAAAQAREKAIAAYLAYRRDGGEAMSGSARLCTEFGKLLLADKREEATALLGGIQHDPDLPVAMRPTVAALQSILSGSRDRALAADPNLDCDDAAELHLLLDRLGVP